MDCCADLGDAPAASDDAGDLDNVSGGFPDNLSDDVVFGCVGPDAILYYPGKNI
jgi:hypothetical protein